MRNERKSSTFGALDSALYGNWESGRDFGNEASDLVLSVLDELEDDVGSVDDSLIEKYSMIRIQDLHSTGFRPPQSTGAFWSWLPDPSWPETLSRSYQQAI